MGGTGPLAPPTTVTTDRDGIRYVNVGTSFDDSGKATNIDLVVTNRSPYTPFDASLNGLNSAGHLAQINVACNTHVLLRVTTTTSCATAPSCKICDGLTLQEEIDSCYSAGCACFGTTVRLQTSCSGTNKESLRLGYHCDGMHEQLVLPSQALVTMTVFDFDKGLNGEYDEILSFPSYAYEKAGLRPVSDNVVVPTVLVDKSGDTLTLTATASGDASNNPSNPLSLTDKQAANGVQIFFRATQGYVEATFTVSSSAVGCTGRSLLFAGDSALCAPPPPQPPMLPSPPSPPPLPPPMPPPSPSPLLPLPLPPPSPPPAPPAPLSPHPSPSPPPSSPALPTSQAPSPSPPSETPSPPFLPIEGVGSFDSQTSADSSTGIGVGVAVVALVLLLCLLLWFRARRKKAADSLAVAAVEVDVVSSSTSASTDAPKRGKKSSVIGMRLSVFTKSLPPPPPPGLPCSLAMQESAKVSEEDEKNELI